MKERGILFSAPMVRALLAGTKTQTRRTLKSEHAEDADVWAFDEKRGMWESGIAGDFGRHGHGEYVRCPYGVPGDRLWVRETWAVPPGSESRDDVAYRADLTDAQIADETTARRTLGRSPAPWRPGIHMFRWASRITLDITAVRVERLQTITEADAKAEGATPYIYGHGFITEDEIAGDPGIRSPSMYRAGFEQLWRQINGCESWDANQWVWVVEFPRLEAQERAA